MTSDPHATPCDQADHAWTFVLGDLTQGEYEAFLEHLTLGCAACGREIADARRRLADVDLALADRTLSQGHSDLPGDALKQRLMDTITPRPKHTAFGRHVAQPSPAAVLPTEFPGVALAARSEEGWSLTEAPGVWLKTLAEDRERRVATVLVRMEPGSSYPAHRHAAREECFVLSGDLAFGEQRMRSGDYQVAEPGSVHPVQATEKGCTLLILSSLDDEPV